ncbi:MAG: deoxyribonuclease IV [Candidatus Babeliales bacterium]
MSSKKELLIGAHVSIAGGVHNAFQRALSIGASTFQIFTASSRSWNEKPLSIEECALFDQARKDSGIDVVVSHASYLINIASSVPKIFHPSQKALKDELVRCQQLGIQYLVLHPGAHTGSGVDVGIENVARALDTVLEAVPGKTMIVLESMAGQGTTLGGTFEELKAIRAACTHKKRIGFCLDTCHMYSAGYDIASDGGYEKVVKECDSLIGLEHVKVIHVNDSKTKLASHVDRHEALGKGTIPLAMFDLLVNDRRFNDVPKILETPTDLAMELYAKEIAMLKKMAG